MRYEVWLYWASMNTPSSEPETNYETNCGQFVNHLRSEFFALRLYELVGSYRLLI